MNTIFISWSRETRPIAEAITAWLSSRCTNDRGWMSDADIVAGQKWRSEIDKALKTAQCSLACIGPSAISSPWVLYEAGAIAATKPIIPVTLLVPLARLPPILSDIQVLSAFQNETALPNLDFPASLARALASPLLNCAIQEDATADSALLSALQAFAQEQTRFYVSALRATKRADSLVEILRFIDAHPNTTPRSISESDVINDILGKKFLVALALFWLKEQGFVEISEFDNITSGKLSISLSGKLVLRATEYSNA